MPQAIGDPDELIKFANTLAQYASVLEAETNNLAGEFAHLGDSWQDDKRAAFEEEFNALVGEINHFKSTCDEKIPYLHNLAEKLRAYLDS